MTLTRRMSQGELRTTAVRMANALRHRGPDDGGVWVDVEAGLALSHRRLSIIDLSSQGAQPMSSACGRFVLVFNGEIYNFRALREELEGLGHGFRGHSDTEVMLAAIVQWGLANALLRFNGMFALALWDRTERVLHLVRDRLGEKPLYYGWMGDVFLFASELKALRVHPNFRGEINRQAVALLMRYNCIPAPHCIYEKISKLLPATILTVQAGNSSSSKFIEYWSAGKVAERGVAHPLVETKEEAIEHLDALLRNSVQLRMLADVPVGAFLSGGVDSSTVVALMQAQSSRPVKTFSIGFSEASYSEAQYAKQVARALGTEHLELYIAPKDAIEAIPRLPRLYDEPFSDSSQIPTFLVSQFARGHVAVALTGDGGDELFGGYNRYFWGSSVWQHIGWIPSVIRRQAAYALTAVSSQSWDHWFALFKDVLPAKLIQRRPGDKLHKLSEVLGAESPEAMYRVLVSHWKHPERLVLGATEPSTALSDHRSKTPFPDFARWMMYMDLVSYLPDDILVKVDRASMGVGLEARVPFLDHRVVEFAWQVPLSMKIQPGESKWLLRQVLYKHVPKKLIERPKWGFGIPLDTWLRGSLRDWVENLISEERLRREGFLDSALVREKWQEHLSGKRNWQYHLWDVLMFQAWLEDNGVSVARSSEVCSTRFLHA
ncbi:MAG: asparagine synthase (glutamine-hydrolyzing) [Nitrospira sp.]|nr:asparagine synthase (glutamine-hydrolyzing) [Nitrospira sp.]